MERARRCLCFACFGPSTVRSRPLLYSNARMLARNRASLSPYVYMTLRFAFFSNTTRVILTSSSWIAGILQGFGAPSCAKILTSWFAAKERGTYWVRVRSTEATAGLRVHHPRRNTSSSFLSVCFVFPLAKFFFKEKLTPTSHNLLLQYRACGTLLIISEDSPRRFWLERLPARWVGVYVQTAYYHNHFFFKPHMPMTLLLFFSSVGLVGARHHRPRLWIHHRTDSERFARGERFRAG